MKGAREKPMYIYTKQNGTIKVYDEWQLREIAMPIPELSPTGNFALIGKEKRNKLRILFAHLEEIV